jgi:hypothetical protein
VLRHFRVFSNDDGRPGQRASESTATVVESGSVGITTVIPSRGPPGGSPGRYYVKVVADEESLGETAACLPVYCRARPLSLSLSLSPQPRIPDGNVGLRAR